MKNPWIIIGIITVVLFGGAIWYSGSATEANNEGVEVIQNIKGNPDAAVTLVEYSDLQCPACAAFQPSINQILEEFGDTLRFEYKHFPLPIHTFAVQASVAAEAAGQQDKFFEFHDLLFENQQNWSNAAAPNSFFLQYADELGLDMDMFRRHMKSSVLRDKVQSELAEGRGLNVTGTPTFFLNGQRMQFDTYAAFIEQVTRAVNPSLGTTTEATATDSGIRFGL
jgi:protein-disulfide isomerase